MTIPTRPGSEDSDNPDGRERLHSVESDPLGEGQESFQHPTGPKLNTEDTQEMKSNSIQSFQINNSDACLVIWDHKI